MAEQYRAQFNSEGQEVARPNTGAPSDTPAPSQPAYREGGVVYKVQVDENGNTSSTVTRRSAAPKSEPVRGAYVQDPVLGPIGLDRAKADSTITIPGMGDSSAQAWEQIGMLRRLPTGGYELAGQAARQAADALDAPPQTKQDAPADSEPVSLAGVQGTSPTTDLSHKMLRKDAGEAVANGLTMAIIKGSETSGLVSEIAQRSHQDPKDVQAAVDQVTADYTRAAKQVVFANGVPNRDGSFEAFVQWASDKAPDAAMTAFQNFVERHDAAGLGRLARQWARSGQAETTYSDEAILNAEFGDGIKAIRTNEHGVVLVIPGHGQMSLRAAIQRGLVRVS